MNLAAKASQRGYAMAALLVAMSVMAVLMSVAMPTWSRMIQRENEEELIFRGNQYARAINQYQRKFANASPPNLDVLVEQHMLRKKFRDPFATDAKGEFALLRVSSQGTGAAGSRGTGGAGASGGIGSGGRIGGTATAGSVAGRGSESGPIIGVVSKNTSESIRTFNGKTHYNEWEFIGLQQSTQAGGGGRGGPPQGAPPQGGRGGPGGASRGGTGTFDRDGPSIDGSGQQPGRGRFDLPPPRGQIQPPQRGAQ